MKKTIFTILCGMAACLFSITKAQAQCQANFNIYQDTTIGAPAHTYIGENICQGANFLGIDTINYIYIWTWGDGTSTTAPFPSHTYATTGNYTICVLMQGINPVNCSDTFCMNATINKDAAMATVNFKKPAVATTTTNISEKEFSVFPNPATDKLNITGLQNENYTFSIYSIEGKLIATPALQSNQYVSVAELANGNYLLKISNTAGKSTVLKFFKN